MASNHMPRHLCLHRGEGVPDARSNAGGFFCDLCGLVFRSVEFLCIFIFVLRSYTILFFFFILYYLTMWIFRQHFNLIKHWRTGCAEIQANLPNDVELTLDNDQLCGMVKDLLKRAVTIEMDNLPEVKSNTFFNIYLNIDLFKGTCMWIKV